MADEETPETRSQRWYKEKKTSDPNYSRDRMRRYREAHPDWYEKTKETARKRMQEKLADPEYKAKKNAQVQQYRRERRASDPEYLERVRGWSRDRYYRKKAADPDYVRKFGHYTRRMKFGLTQQEYDDLLAKSGGLCAICGKPETHVKRGKVCELSIDHNHKTGKVRGLLCSNCNVALGYFLEDPESMRKGADYIEKHNL